MKKHILILIVNLVFASLVCADKIKPAQVKDIAEQYIASIMTKDFGKWSQLMLNTGSWNEDRFVEHLNKFPLKNIQIEKIKKAKTGYDIRMKFDPQLTIETEWSQTATSHYYVQMLPDGKIKYDILVFHPIPFAMSTCHYAIEWLEHEKKTDMGPRLKEHGIPLFGYDSSAPINDQRKSLRKIKKWLLDDGEDWDRSDPIIPCPEELYEINKNTLKR